MNSEVPSMTSARERSKWKATLVEYTRSILIAVVLALLIRAYVVHAYVIPSGSMEDTLEIGDRILVNRFVYGTKIPFSSSRILEIREPVRGDVVVFQFPKDHTKDYIKRVIGIPGDRIWITNKKVYVNGIAYENPHEVHKDTARIPAIRSPRDNIGAITVPADSYFVMGDNRDSSLDSRFWGFVKREEIKGLAFLKYWSWDGEKNWVRWSEIGKLIE
jgi:signal peptidase I